MISAPLSRRALWTAMSGPAVLVATVMIAAALQPGYAHSEAISLLYADGAERAWLVSFGFAFSGACLAVLAVHLWWARRPLGRVVPTVAFVSAGLVIAAAFAPCSVGCPAPWEGGSTQDALHFALILPAFTGFAVAPLAALRTLRGTRHIGYRRLTLVLAVPTVVGGFLTFLGEAIPLGPMQGMVGVWQRVALTASLAWFVATGLVLLEAWRPMPTPAADAI